MKKSNYALFIFLCITGVSVPSVAWATVTITEVMYNPAGSDAGREWIELYNNDSESVEITSGQKGWKVSDGSNHILAQALTVPPGGFVIIATNPATFRAQYGNALFVVKSALNLTNTSGTLSLLDARGEVVDTVSYTKDLGGFEDGTSLHRVGSTFAPDVPNPGVAPAPGVPKSAPPAQKTNCSGATCSNYRQVRLVGCFYTVAARNQNQRVKFPSACSRAKKPILALHSCPHCLDGIWCSERMVH